jgi:hypothetical protein
VLVITFDKFEYIVQSSRTIYKLIQSMLVAEIEKSARAGNATAVKAVIG